MKWENDLFKEIRAISSTIKTEYYLGDRAFCPLCHRGSSHPSAEGFALPNGLYKHLMGIGARECSVFNVLKNFTWDYFETISKKESILKKGIHAERMATETLLKISLHKDPDLLNLESTLSFRSYKSEKQLKLIEPRLKQLGFKKTTKNRVRSYIFENEEYFVYADPRELGKVVFYAYKKPLPIKASNKSRSLNEYSFYMMDSWKNDLKEKFMRNLQKEFCLMVN